MKRRDANRYDSVMAIRSQMDRRDFVMSRTLEVMLETSSVGSSSDASDAFFSVLISVVITPQING